MSRFYKARGSNKRLKVYPIDFKRLKELISKTAHETILKKDKWQVYPEIPWNFDDYNLYLEKESKTTPNE